MTFFVTTSIDEAIEAAKRFSENATRSNVADCDPEDLKREGMAAAIDAKCDEWLEMALKVMKRLCEQHEYVNSDMISYLNPGPASGAIFSMAARKGWIRYSGKHIQSKIPSNRSRDIRLWESLLITP